MNKPLAFFDPHIHMTSRTTCDYEKMRERGIRAIVEPAFWMGQPRTHVGTFEDYFLGLIGWEKFRAQQFGIHHFCTLALNPKEANNTKIADGVLDLLPYYLEKESVVAVGEIGLDDQTPQEEKVFMAQIQLAIDAGLPILVHTPHRDKKSGTKRCLDIVKESGIKPEMVLIDHNNEETVGETLSQGYWAGHSIYPETKMSIPRMAEIVRKFGTNGIIVNSAADWGVSDPLTVPDLGLYMLERGFESKVISQLLWENPLSFFEQSGRIKRSGLNLCASYDQTELFEGNSVLRGQNPKVTYTTSEFRQVNQAAESSVRETNL